MAYRLEQLAERLGANLIGDPDVSIEGIGSIFKALPGQITFLTNSSYREQLKETLASAVLLSHKDKDLSTLPRLVCDEPYVAFAVLSQIFQKRISQPTPGVHALATVADDCKIGKGVSIGAGATINSGVVLGDQCVISPNCTISENCTLGARCQLFPGVVLMPDVHLGDDVLIYPNAVIGSDGFGYADNQGKWVKIVHSGRVIIGDKVEIGANTTIDRGTLDDTVIEEGVKIDNQVQIAHNVRIGAHTVIAGCVGISGTTTIGHHCRIGGRTGVINNLTICDHVTIFPETSVIKSIDKAGDYASIISFGPRYEIHKNSMRIKSLGGYQKRLKKLEKMATKAREGP